MDPMGAALIGIGGAIVGAGIHQHGVDQGYAYGFQNGILQGRNEGYILGLQERDRLSEQRISVSRNPDARVLSS